MGDLVQFRPGVPGQANQPPENDDSVQITDDLTDAEFRSILKSAKCLDPSAMLRVLATDSPHTE